MITTTETVTAALGLTAGALFNANEAGAVVAPQATRSDHLMKALAAIDPRVGVEVGVERAHFTRELCTALPGTQVYGVDAWTPYREYRDHVTAAKLNGFYAEAQDRLAPFPNAQLLRGFSADMSHTFDDGALDFVYIDGNHTLPYVIADLAAWSRKVRSGGIVAGHDFGRRKVGHVREAVEAWTRAYEIAPWFILAGDNSPSFLWVKG